MLLNKLDRYVKYIQKTEKDKKVSFDSILETYKTSSDSEKIKMLLEMDEENRCKIKAMINGGII
jgi:uncharacterized OsmC-like protein